jgi:hypothetical protein
VDDDIQNLDSLMSSSSDEESNPALHVAMSDTFSTHSNDSLSDRFAGSEDDLLMTPTTTTDVLQLPQIAPSTIAAFEQPTSPPPEESRDVSRTGRIRKRRVIDLKACECGSTVTDVEIEAGDGVIQCRVQGCETGWVRYFSYVSRISILTVQMLYSVPLSLYEL